MITGSIVALITPMHADGSIDWEALDRLVFRLKNAPETAVCLSAGHGQIRSAKSTDEAGR